MHRFSGGQKLKAPRRNGPWKSIDIRGTSWTSMKVHEAKTQHFFRGYP